MSHKPMAAPPAQISPARRLAACAPWAAALAVILVYALFYGTRLAATTQVPTFDQAAYLVKTYQIADAFYRHPADILRIATYFGLPDPNRPPLLMAAAALTLGPAAAPWQIGLFWMALRLVVLLAALRAIARRAGTAAFVPAAVLAILAAPGSLLLYPHMYMMDQSFEAFGLLAFAWLVADWQTATPRTAALGALGALFLFMIKPASVVFLLPLATLLAWRALRTPPSPSTSTASSPRQAFLRWIFPYLLLAAALLLLLFTPYPRAVLEQYALGNRGYWAHRKTLLEILTMATFLLPPWLLALAAARLILRPRPADSPPDPARPFILAAALVAAWWFLFNAVLTYTLDPRVLSGAMPVAVVGALLLFCRRPAWTAAATTLAALAFAASLASAAGLLGPSLQKSLAFVAPLPPVQRPIEEVGILPLARQIKHAVSAAEAAGTLRSRKVMFVTSDDFVELAAMRLAMRFTGGQDNLFMDSHPWGADYFNIHSVASFEWFVTKQKRNATPLDGDVWTALDAIDALIRDPASPLASSFEKVADLPIRQPDLDDTVTLYRLRRVPPDAQLAAALRFVAPRFKNRGAEAMIRQQIEELEKSP